MNIFNKLARAGPYQKDYIVKKINVYKQYVLQLARFSLALVSVKKSN